MCEWSQEIVVCSRLARQGELLVSHHFRLGLIGLVDTQGQAICVAQGTELAFEADDRHKSLPISGRDARIC